MSKAKKRIEAICEIFESEKLYCDDLELWEVDFRRAILNMTNLSTKKKYTLNDAVFINMESLRHLHTRIFSKLRAKNLEVIQESIAATGGNIDLNISLEDEFVIKKDGSMDTDRLEYASVFLEMLGEFKIYEEYVKNLPKSVYEFEKLMHTHSRFAEQVNSFLLRKNVNNLGTNNFFYRPSSKIARYPLLLRAIAKNEENQEFKNAYLECIEKLKEIIHRIDDIYKERSELFTVYTYIERLKYKNSLDNKFSLGLMFKDTQILKASKLIVKKSVIEPASYKQVYLFRKFVLICNTIENQFDDVYINTPPIFLSKVKIIKKRFEFFDKADNLSNYFPIYLVQKEILTIRGIYFEDAITRDHYYKLLKSAIRANESKEDGTAFQIQNIGEYDGNETLRSVYIVKGIDQSSTDPDQQSISDNTTNDSVDNDDNNLPKYFTQNGEAIPDNIIPSRGKLNFNRKCAFITTSDIEEASSSYESEGDWESIFMIKNKIIKNEEGKILTGKTTLNKDTGKFHNFKGIFESFYRNKLQNRDSEYDQDVESSISSSEVDNTKSCWDSYFSTDGLFISNLSFDLPNLEYSLEPGVIIFSTDSGIYKKYKSGTTKISDLKAKNIMYDEENQLFYFQVKHKLHIAELNSETVELKSKSINLDVGRFFIGKCQNSTYVSLTNKGDYNFSLIYLLTIESDDKKNEIKLFRKLYVGYDIYSINYLRGRIIIACKDFEVVDIDSLRTQDLLEVYDPYTSTFCGHIENLQARAIFKVDEDTFLLCFNGLGFYIDSTGRYKYTHISFNWESVGSYFKIFGPYVYCLSDYFLSVFQLETGLRVYCQSIPNMKFVEGIDEVYLYNSESIFKVSHGVSSFEINDKMCEMAMDRFKVERDEGSQDKICINPQLGNTAYSIVENNVMYPKDENSHTELNDNKVQLNTPVKQKVLRYLKSVAPREEIDSDDKCIQRKSKGLRRKKISFKCRNDCKLIDEIARPKGVKQGGIRKKIFVRSRLGNKPHENGYSQTDNNFYDYKHSNINTYSVDHLFDHNIFTQIGGTLSEPILSKDDSLNTTLLSKTDSFPSDNSISLCQKEYSQFLNGQVCSVPDLFIPDSICSKKTQNISKSVSEIDQFKRNFTSKSDKSLLSSKRDSKLEETFNIFSSKSNNGKYSSSTIVCSSNINNTMPKSFTSSTYTNESDLASIISAYNHQSDEMSVEDIISFYEDFDISRTAREIRCLKLVARK